MEAIGILVDGGMRPWTQEIYLESLTRQPTRTLQPAVRCRALSNTPIPPYPNVPMNFWSRPPSPNADSFAARSSLTEQARPSRGPVHFVRKVCRSPFVRPLYR